MAAEDNEREQEERATPRRSGFVRRWSLRLALVFLFFWSAIGLLVLAVADGLGRDRVRGVIEQLASDALGAELRIGGIDGPLFEALRIQGITLTLGDERIAEIDDLTLSWDPWGWLRGEAVELEDVSANGVRLWLVRRPDGSWNTDALQLGGGADEDSEPSSFALHLEQASLSEVMVDVRGLGEGARGQLRMSGALGLGSLDLPIEQRDLIAALEARAFIDVASNFVTPPAAAAMRVPIDPANPVRPLGRLEVRLAEGELALEARSQRPGEFALDARAALAGWLEAERAGAADVQLSFEALDLAPWFGDDRLRTALSGKLQLVAALPANAPPEKARLQIVLDARDVRAAKGGESAAGALPAITSLALRGSLADERWKVDQLVLDVAGAKLRGQGNGEAMRAKALEFDLEVPDLARLARLLPGGREAAEAFGGEVVLHAELKGEIERPEGRLRFEGKRLVAPQLVIDSGVFEIASVSDAPAGWARYALSQLRVTAPDVSVRQIGSADILWRGLAEPAVVRIAGFELDEENGARLRLDAKLASGTIEDATLSAHSIDLQAVLRAFSIDQAIDGDIDLGIRASGPFAKPRVVGAIAWLEPSVLDLDLERVDGRFELAEGGGEAFFGVRVRGAQPLRVDARFPHPLAPGIDGDTQAFLASQALEVDVVGDGIALEMFSPFLPRTVRELAGRANVSLTVRGTPTGPDFDGSLVVRGASIYVPVTRRRFEPIDGTLHFDRDKVSLPSLAVGEAKHRALLTGEVTLDSWQPRALAVKAEFDDFVLARSPVVSSNVNGTITIEGPFDGIQIEGDLKLRKVEVNVPEGEDPALREILVIATSEGSAKTRIVEAEATESKVWERATMDVRLAVPQKTWIRGRGAELDITGDIRALKERGTKPRLEGEASVVRGTYKLLGKRFEVRRGVTYFDGSSTVDPVIDIEAVYRVSDVNVVVELGGRLSDPTLVRPPYTEPETTEDDALAYLTFGRPLSELGAGEQRSASSLALQGVVGVAISQLAASVKGGLPVDTVDVRIAEDGQSGGFEVGTYVGSDLFVRYGHSFGTDSYDDLSLEYRLSKQFSLEAQATTRGDAGVDLIWQRDF